MSYRPLVQEEEEEEKKPLNEVFPDKAVQGPQGELEEFGVGKETAFNQEEEGDRTKLLEGEERPEGAVPTVEPEKHPDRILLHSDDKRFKYTRIVLGTSSFVLLLVFLTVAIVLIAVSPKCDEIQELQWWQTTVIYQCYPRSFQDSDGDGNGDLNGIRSRVNYFADVGIETVWLNPIFKSPKKDGGYDISNFMDIDPLFGNMSDFKALLNELHEKGIRLLLDYVPNHTSDEHSWFVESRSSRNSSKRDWYIWADANANGGPPNNWISVFGGSAWSYDHVTQQYYLHQFSEHQPDLNYRNPDVVRNMKDVLRFWLDMGVDGFRVDAVIFLLEDPDLRNETRNPAYEGDNCTVNISDPDCYNSLIHDLTTNYAGIHDIIRNWRSILNTYSGPRFMVGEVYNPIETVMLYYGNHGDEFHFPFNFFLVENANWTGTSVSQIVADWLDHMPKGAWPNWVLGNHDNSRIASEAGIYLARALNVLLLTLPGTPTTYYGEEILMTDVYVPPPQRQDPYQDRDKERTPMQWNTSANAGFSSNDSTWLPIPDNYTVYNVEVENANDTSMLTLYKKLVELRSSSPSLMYADYKHIENSTHTFAYLRHHSGTDERFLVVINFSPNSTTVDLTAAELQYPEVALSSGLNRNGTVSLASVELSGGEALVIKGT